MGVSSNLSYAMFKIIPLKAVTIGDKQWPGTQQWKFIQNCVWFAVPGSHLPPADWNPRHRQNQGRRDRWGKGRGALREGSLLVLKLEYFFHLKPLLAAQFLDTKLPGLWHLDPFPSIPFPWAAKTCFETYGPGKGWG